MAYLCTEFKNTTSMETNEKKHSRFSDYNVEMFTREETPANKLLRGRVLLAPAKSELTFIENDEKRKGNKEVHRTLHSRTVIRMDGTYTTTFRGYSIEEKYLVETLLAEMRDTVTNLKNQKKCPKK